MLDRGTEATTVPTWECKARKAGTAGGNDPQDCDWPYCGCDPVAEKVLEALAEQDMLKPQWLKTLSDMRRDGWSVVVHNDYKLHGERHTFWALAKGPHMVKGEGPSDQHAFDEIRAAVFSTPRDGLVEMLHEIRELLPKTEEFYRLTLSGAVKLAIERAFAQGRLGQFERMKNHRAIDPTYWDLHEGKRLREAARRPEKSADKCPQCGGELKSCVQGEWCEACGYAY